MVSAEPAADDYVGWVARLDDPLRAGPAEAHLVRCGSAARDAVLAGLASPSDDVRRHCARVLDHLADETSFPALIGLLDDPSPAVRIEAAHALACDRCKSDGCRLDDAAVLPKAIDLLLHDDDAHVRASAAELVGRFVHTSAAAADALDQAAHDDPSPAVRKKAAWYTPGGTIHARTRPRVSARRAGGR